MHNNQPGEGTYLPVSEYMNALAGVEPKSSSVMAEALKMAAVVAEIADQYNVRRMTLHQLVEMSRRLYLAGAIDLAELAVLSCRPDLYDEFDYEAETYQAMQQEADRPRDFISGWESHLREVQHHHPHPTSLFLTRQIVELLQSFEPFDNIEDDE